MDQEQQRTEYEYQHHPLATALAEAQKELRNPQKDRENPYFQSRYATLDALQDASREILAKHGLSVTQCCQPAAQIELKDENGRLAPFLWTLRTVLMHSSGQTIESVMPLVMVTKGPQQFGSELTYMRRYSLAAILGMAADEDDDANAAQGKQTAAAATSPEPPKKRQPRKVEPKDDILGERTPQPNPDDPDWTVSDQKGPVDTDTRPDEIPGLEPPPIPEEMTLLEQVRARLQADKFTEDQLMILMRSFKLTRATELGYVDQKTLGYILERWETVQKRLR